MEGTISIPVPMQVFLDLSDYLDGRRMSEEFAEVAGRTITEWLAMQTKPMAPAEPALGSGYQWKSLFLPSGTRLRIVFKRNVYHADVVGNQIRHEGQATTPAALVNTLAGTTRNAWKHIWLLMPGEADWRLAESCRR